MDPVKKEVAVVSNSESPTLLPCCSSPFGFGFASLPNALSICLPAPSLENSIEFCYCKNRNDFGK